MFCHRSRVCMRLRARFHWDDYHHDNHQLRVPSSRPGPLGDGGGECGQYCAGAVVDNRRGSSCTGTVTFANSAGAVIGKATAFTVASGQIATVTVTATAAGITAARGEILASIQQTTTRRRLLRVRWCIRSKLMTPGAA